MFACSPAFGTNPFDGGRVVDPTDTTRGIAYSEAEWLGRTYVGVAPDGSMRVYKIVKNVTGSTLFKAAAVKYSTSAGRYGKDVTICTDDTDPVAGIVCDSYINGVPTGMWFRMTIFAEKHLVRLGTTSDARCTIAIGDVLVSNSDNGYVWEQASAAANNAVQNRIGWALEATTDVTDAGAWFDAKISILRI